MKGLTSVQNLFFCILIAALITPPAWPQASTATVSGTVRDQTGAVIPTAAVTLANQATNATSKTTANETGFYLFPGLVPGPYRLTVEAAGMQKFEGALTVAVQQSAVVDVTMKVGQTATEVAVQEVTPMLSVDNPTLGGSLERTRIEQLPINGRNVITLLQTIPGQEGTRAFGLRDGAFEVVLDGSALADRLSYGGGSRISYRQPGLDSIQEFKVENNNSSAKFTRPTSVIMTTKGGTNDLHGSAFETNRNNAVGLARSRTDYYTKPPFLNRNEFGVSAGGPVIIPKLYHGKNKTFWFFAYEALRNISASTQGFQVPTQAMRDGDMSGLVNGAGQRNTIYDPWSTDTNTWARVPFPNSQLPAARLNPLAKYLFSVTQLPTLPNVNPNVANNWFGPVSQPTRSWTTSTRIDQRFSDKDQFYGRYTEGNYRNLSQFYGLPTLNFAKVPANTEAVLAPNKSVALSHVHTFSPTFFNELLVSASRQSQVDLTGDPGVNYDAALGLPNPFNADAWPIMSSMGLGGNYQFSAQNTNAWASFYGILDDNATKIKGKHEFLFGFHFRYDQLNELPDQQFTAGIVDWATGATALYDPASSRTNPQALPLTGDQLANFYLGLAEYQAQLTRSFFYYRDKEYAGYLQDNFRVTARLTLNLGLRYEYYSPITEKNNVSTGFDVANHSVVLGTDLNTLYKFGYTLPTVVNRLTQLGAKFEAYQQAGMPQALMTSDHKDFGPRLGFAYRVGDGARSFVVRGGYSIAYFHIPIYSYGARMRKNAPFTATFTESVTQGAYSPDGIGNYGLRSVPTLLAGVNSTNAIPLDATQSLQPGSANVSYFALNQPDPRVQNWNVTLEKEIKGNTVVRVGWIGNHSSHLEQLYQYNNTTPTYIWYATTGQALPTGVLSGVGTQPYDKGAYSRVEAWQNTGWGNSNAIRLELQRRYSRGFAYQVFYVMDNNFAAGGQGFSGTSIIPEVNQFLPGTVPTDLNRRNAFINYQRDTTTPHHRVAWNWVADLPVGAGKPILGNAGKVLNRLVGGWQVAGIGSLRSTYFTLPTGDFPTGVPLQIYGYKYPIQNCTSGTCFPAYLWYNGYIPSNRINSVDANGKPNGYEGIPADYKPAVSPLIPYGSTALPPNAPAGTNVSSFWGTNTVWVPLKDGTVQRTTWAGLAPLQHQYLSSVRQWGLDASLFKTVPINERIRLRLQADFFNVLNHPGNPNSVGSESGVLSVQSSGNSPRTLQLTLRLTW
jgi:hypothetical protein